VLAHLFVIAFLGGHEEPLVGLLQCSDVLRAAPQRGPPDGRPLTEIESFKEPRNLTYIDFRNPRAAVRQEANKTFGRESN
jgi:hypothetical protein